MKNIAIACGDEKLNEQAKTLADDLNLPFISDISNDVDYLLCVTEYGLQLQKMGKHVPAPLMVDFLHGAVAHRQQYGGGRGQLIARAVGIKRDFQPTIIDANAGFGRDAYVLACLGCQVKMLERNNVIAALLEDGLLRAKHDPDFAKLKLTLVKTDAVNFLTSLSDNQLPDVVYLDPMFPSRTKSALVKKEMQILQDILSHEENNEALFAIATKVALKRVVVKRPKLAEPLLNQIPDLQFKGKSTRFDVYLPSPSP